jgi:hypothetical protein
MLVRPKSQNGNCSPVVMPQALCCCHTGIFTEKYNQHHWSVSVILQIIQLLYIQRQWEGEIQNSVRNKISLMLLAAVTKQR